MLTLSVILILLAQWILIIRNTVMPVSSFADRQTDTVADTIPQTEAVALLAIYARDFFALTAAANVWVATLSLAVKRN